MIATTYTAEKTTTRKHEQEQIDSNMIIIRIMITKLKMEMEAMKSPCGRKLLIMLVSAPVKPPGVELSSLINDSLVEGQLEKCS